MTHRASFASLVSLGARVVAVDASEGPVVEAVLDATGGAAAVSVDALGSLQTCVDSIRCLAPRGRHVQVGFAAPSLGRPEIPMERVVALELEILGSHGMSASSYPELLSLVASGAVRPDLLVTREIGLDDPADALRDVGREPGVTVVTSF